MDALNTTYTVDELREIFEKMDWDKNGMVSPIEFKSYLANLKKGEEINADEVYKAFNEIDADGSKNIQWEEFLSAMTDMKVKGSKSEISEDELTAIFHELDDDGNGYITLKEAKKAHKKLCEKFNIKRAQIDDWIQNTDYDSDGKITIEEFKLGMAGNALVNDF